VTKFIISKELNKYINKSPIPPNTPQNVSAVKSIVPPNGTSLITETFLKCLLLCAACTPGERIMGQ
jgi:hypothetical protein